ncbi:TPA: YodC family protein [Photobacterium damselae]|uniref:YodC family protein n=1 Tax=Photobacterium damselae TaxID=38293 RepID=UPI003C6E5F89
MAFQTGEIVKLKSGGPDMTVQSPVGSSSTTFYCQWFAGKKLERGTFPADSLEYVTQDEE